VTVSGAASPVPADFPPPAAEADRVRWDEADRAARPDRLARLRARFEGADVDAYLGVRTANARYLTGFELGDGEEAVAGDSGRFLVGRDEILLMTDSRYSIQALREAPEAQVVEVYGDLPARWPELVARVGARRIAVEAGYVSHALWDDLAAAAPDVELIPAGGWLEADRAIKEATEIERIESACAVADRALAGLLASIRPGVTELELALDLEWRMRTGGSDGLAFNVACLAGPEAALPHGSPGHRPIRYGAVLLFDFGAKVAGYRSDMTRTLFVGDPAARDLAIYGVVAAAQQGAIAALEAAARKSAATGAPMPSGKVIDTIARDVIDADGRWPPYLHGLGHGIGLATHELPTLGRRATDAAIPTPTVFSIEPGIYLEGETGVRIEDLFVLDTDAGTVRSVTQFPSEVLVLGR
jgi:Xaa-Pro aminopeptidase